MPPAHYTLSTSLAQQIRTGFQSRPSLQDVAVYVLQNSLGRMYPWLSIDQAQPVLVTPRYRRDNDILVTSQKNQALADALIERQVDGLFEDYTLGQYLVRDAGQPPSQCLSVRSDDLERVLNDWGPRLIDVYQEALVRYWMSPTADYLARYLWLSALLKQALLATARATTTLTVEQFETVTKVVNNPEYYQRSTLDGVSVHIVDQWGAVGANETELLRGLVIIKKTGQVESALLFTLSAGIQVAPSLAALGTLLAPLLTSPGEHLMQWRLYQPSGNIFHSFSLTFLAKHLSDIQAVLPKAREFPHPERTLERALRVITSDFDSAPEAGDRQLRRLREALPSWLVQADPDRQMEMSRYAVDLAQQVSKPGWKPFDYDIPAPAEFAGKVLAEQMALDHPGKPALAADRINVRLKGNAAAAPFWRVPASTPWTLVELALLGGVGLEAAQLELSSASPSDPAVWLTPQDALSLIERADIARKYDQLITEKLKGNAEEVRWRQARFTEQLCLQLPMLALEYSLKYPQAFSRVAYQMLVAVLGPEATRKVAEHTIVLRRLAFIVSKNAVPDIALNLFVIGPQDTGAGPYVLYRPMSEVKLIEFSSWARLLAAIAAPGPLQHQVLAWLTPQARLLYAPGSLTPPRAQVADSVDFGSSLWTNPGARLADEPVVGDYLEQLFQSSVASMLIGPDRPTTSEADTFWSWTRHYFGLGLVFVLPFLGGPVGRLLGWLLVAWFSVRDVQEILARDNKNKLPSIIDLLLNIGLLLLSRGRVTAEVSEPVVADALLDEAQGFGAAQTLEMHWQEGTEQLLEGVGDSRPMVAQEPLERVGAVSDLVRGNPQLEQSWSGLYNRLSVIRQAELALYRVRPPMLRERINSGEHRGLYRAGSNLYANVQGEWYPVDDKAGRFHVVNNDLPVQEGPQLISANPGEWTFSPEPALPEDLLQAQVLEQRRQAQLTSDEQHRLDLDAEYNKLLAMFDAQEPIDHEFMQVLGDSYAATGKLEQIDRLLTQTEIRVWCARSLLDFLKRRRELMLIRGYGELHHRFSGGLVTALRNQVALLSSKRKALLKADKFDSEWFDAQNLTTTVLDDKRFQPVAARLPAYRELERKALATCVEAEQHFAEMKQSAKSLDATIGALELAAWHGKRMSCRWQEIHLRTLALLCFESKTMRYKDAVLELIGEVAGACSLRLLTRRELFAKGRFNLDRQVAVLSDVLDTLNMATCRVFYQLGPLPAYLNPKALGDYRRAIRGVYRELERELIDVYQQYEGASLEAISAATDSSPKLIIEVLDGRVIGNKRRFQEGATPVDDVVDVLVPKEHRLIWSFRRPRDVTDSPWREMPVVETQAQEVLGESALAVIGGEANRLWREAEQQFQKISQLESIVSVSPHLVRVEWLRYADKMNRQRDALMAQLRAPATSARYRDLLDFFRDTPNGLYQQILRFQAQGAPVRNRMMLQRFPTSQNLLTLYKAGVIEIIEVDSGSTLARNFEIRESVSNRALWVAHLHYPTQVAQRVGYHFTRGHMKKYADRSVSYATLKERTTVPEQLLNILRGNLDHEVAKTVIFTSQGDYRSA